MEKIILFALMGTTALLLIINAILIAKIAKTKKKRLYFNNLIELDEVIIPFIIRAEGFKNFSSEAKKKYVLTLAMQFAQNQKIKTDYSTISDRIDYFVEFCSQVNTQPKNNCNCDCHK